MKHARQVPCRSRSTSCQYSCKTSRHHSLRPYATSLLFESWACREWQLSANPKILDLKENLPLSFPFPTNPNPQLEVTPYRGHYSKKPLEKASDGCIMACSPYRKTQQPPCPSATSSRGCPKRDRQRLMTNVLCKRDHS